MSTTHQTIIRSRGFIARDCFAVERIVNACFPADGWTAEDREQIIADLPSVYTGSLLCIVASLSDTSRAFSTDAPICGLITIRLTPDIAHVSTMAVLPEYRRAGVGSHLLAHAKSKLWTRQKVTLHVHERAVAAQLLLRSEGFKCVAIMPPWGADAAWHWEKRYEFEYLKGRDDVAMARS